MEKVRNARAKRSIERLFAMLPAAQRRIARELIAGPEAKTYTGLAAELGVHVGTVYEHLRRIRDRHPKVYSALMAMRRRQLAERHQRALVRAREHDAWWFQQPGYLQSLPDL